MELLKIQILRAQIELSYQKVKANKAWKCRFLRSRKYANSDHYKVENFFGVHLSILILGSLQYLVYCLFGTKASAAEVLMTIESTPVTTVSAHGAC